jgi:hypothetical protein
MPVAYTRNESTLQPQLRTQRVLARSHLALVGLMVHAGQMQQAMQQKNAHLVGQRVPMLAGLPSRCFERYSEITGMGAAQIFRSREAQDVRRFVLAAPRPVETPQSQIIGQQYGHLTRQTHG